MTEYTENGPDADESVYMSAEEAMQLLQIKKTKFFTDVENGLIPSELPEGRKRGRLFPREAIMILARRQRRERAQKRGTPYTFTPSTSADVWNAVQNARRVYGPDDVISFERALEWRDRNPDISMSVHRGKHLTGMVTYLPVVEDVIWALTREQIWERDIPLEAIRRWDGPDLAVYVAGIAIIPSTHGTEHERLRENRQRGRYLITHALKWAIALTSQYDIRKWYAIGVSEEGQSILEHLGFHELSLDGQQNRIQGNNQISASAFPNMLEEADRELHEVERRAYVLEDFLTSRSRLVQHFLHQVIPNEDS